MKITRIIRQAPWRTRRQRVGAVLLAIVGTMMIAALYLSVASQATLVGREIQSLERESSSTKEENANLKTELARLLSYRAVNARSDVLGFHPAAAEETHYIVVPGYEGINPVNLTRSIPSSTSSSLLPTEYTQSLFEWFDARTRGASQ
ncbi:MAG: hypothetical protein DRI32_03395 [Chloroflexi bacterium]|nr:MAG: hypothetical protein DRI32_03395 [Chloroflexota bacterium]